MFQISLAAARVNAELTQREAAERLGINVGTLANWETGKSAISVPKFIELCALYNCPMDCISLPG